MTTPYPRNSVATSLEFFPKLTSGFEPMMRLMAAGVVNNVLTFCELLSLALTLSLIINFQLLIFPPRLRKMARLALCLQPPVKTPHFGCLEG